MRPSQNIFHLPKNADRQSLRRYLKELVSEEKYEMAAIVRDKLKAIQHLEDKRIEVIIKPGDRNKDRLLLKREYPIRLSLCRQDLIHPKIGMSQFEALKLTDSEMRRITSKMADIFREEHFWTSLKTIVDSVLNHR